MCDSKGDRLWVRVPLEETKYLIFLFPRFGNDAKRYVDFHHLTLQNVAESGEPRMLTLGSQAPSSYPAMFGVQCEAKNKVLSFSRITE